MFSILVFVLSIGLASASYGGHSAGYDHSIDAAVKSKHSVNLYPVHSSHEPGKTPVVDINSGPLPLTLRFNSHSSQINAIQKHFSHPGQVQKSSAIDEPDLLIQNIKKPVIQEVREVISPYRHRLQEVRPVRERIETLIAKGQDGIGSGHGGGHYDAKQTGYVDSY
ncbi:hypothetical protein SSS_04834 [Sarcoptes scabiei]|uniref:DFP2-like protein 5 n=1 Tax=Sarcoptes scabiei TaxID=52283 RepID=A0A131ZZ22_SARSC|nr:hypothetical protein SSS_04834 [Sarcoptes scabiei]KPM03370.1 DFP2-like protein 5 [Sarcoptes scabiei]UXI19462.1 hypothetical protein NH340_JMT05405 [Sarcoptes scabiei]